MAIYFSMTLRLRLREGLFSKPAMNDGKPVRCWVSTPFSFRLNNQEHIKESSSSK
jgi:hypothetical protein